MVGKIKETNVSKDQEDTFIGVKYLTSSRLFQLQLRDQSFLQQFATQAIFILSYITTAPITKRDPKINVTKVNDMMKRIKKFIIELNT